MKNQPSPHLILGLLIFLVASTPLYSQLEEDHHYRYYPESDPLVLSRLEQWQDLKFGLLMHWGTYSQWGIVESWSICPEDYGWCKREKGSNPGDYDTYKKEYENLITTFNPVKFNPDTWAKAAREAGMRYVVFTTKHHDGFSMWDTRETDYRITSPDCPFHIHEKADITGAIFDAFREQDLWVGAYFSKPDWHSEYYWWPYFPPLDRNVNYDPEAYPERWEKFIRFTHNQIMELMTRYGKIDILWLDGGWVARKEAAAIQESYTRRVRESNTGFLKSRVINQDIRMDELVEKARSQQPGLIVVDRAVPGKNQNYLTPENQVPDKAIPYPWESCIIAGGGWSWVPPERARYKTPRETIHLLADIVSKGGNLLLNIAPGPEGTWHPEAHRLLKEVGKWMNVNSEAIYGTRARAPYQEGNLCFTQKAEEGIIYTIYLAGKDEQALPASVSVGSLKSGEIKTITMPGVKGKLKWKQSEEDLVIEIPETLQENPPCDHAWVFKIQGTL